MNDTIERCPKYPSIGGLGERYSRTSQEYDRNCDGGTINILEGNRGETCVYSSIEGIL